MGVKLRILAVHNGEYAIADGGVDKYKAYIDSIREHIDNYSDTQIILVIGKFALLPMRMTRETSWWMLSSGLSPVGESDGTSDNSAKRYGAKYGLQDALKPAPEAGTWIQAYFEQLLRNANPWF